MTEDVLIEDIDQAVIDRLSMIAAEKGISLEEELREILTSAAEEFAREESAASRNR